MAGIYIHIPFCSQACHYCDFHFSTNRAFAAQVCQGICDEIRIQKKYLSDEPINTIYFGGGTPSILDPSETEKILNTVYETFKVNPNPEITLEANPEDLMQEKLLALKAMGVNRLSIGVQSFNDEVLKFLNRSHSSIQAIQCIENSRKAGFTNLNVDLIYVIPGRDYKKLVYDLNKLIDLSPEHVSAYSLTIEEKTLFGKWSALKKIIAPSDDENAAQFEEVMKRLSGAGYDQYEISNYSKPGCESNHNSGYWKQRKYLGVGPSAHSYNGVCRQANVSNNNTYLKSIQAGTIPATKEILKPEDHINEYLMTSLRTKWGCDLNYLKAQHQFDLITSRQDLIQSSIKSGFMQLDGSTLSLTLKGKMHADKLSSDLFLIT